MAGRFKKHTLRRLSSVELEILQDDDSLSEAEFEAVREESERRETGEYMSEAVWGADGEDDDESRKFEFDPKSIIAGYGLIEGFQIETVGDSL